MLFKWTCAHWVGACNTHCTKRNALNVLNHVGVTKCTKRQICSVQNEAQYTHCQPTPQLKADRRCLPDVCKSPLFIDTQKMIHQTGIPWARHVIGDISCRREKKLLFSYFFILWVTQCIFRMTKDKFLSCACAHKTSFFLAC